jgi:hypothetical protein
MTLSLPSDQSVPSSATPAHFDVFTYILNGFRIFDHRQFVRTRCNQKGVTQGKLR